VLWKCPRIHKLDGNVGGFITIYIWKCPRIHDDYMIGIFVSGILSRENLTINSPKISNMCILVPQNFLSLKLDLYSIALL
jgi:hypothetical protein